MCEECSIQVTPVIRLCRDCVERYGAKWPILEVIRRDVESLALTVSRRVSSLRTRL